MVEFVKNSTALVLFGKPHTDAAVADDPDLKDAVFSLPFVRNNEGDYSEVMEFLIDSLFWFGRNQLMMNQDGELWGGSYSQCVNAAPATLDTTFAEPNEYKQTQNDVPRLTAKVMGDRSGALHHALKQQSFIQTNEQIQTFVNKYTRYAVRTKSFGPGSDFHDKFKNDIRDEDGNVTGFNAANKKGDINLTVFKESFIPKKVTQSTSL